MIRWHEIGGCIEEAADWLERVETVLSEDGDALEHWAALRETVNKIGAARVQVQALLPLHPEIAEAIRAESDDDGRDSPGV